MGKFTWPGIILTIVLFIIIAVFIASKIEVAGATVGLPGFPTDTSPVSLLDVIWDEVGGWINPFD